LIFIYLKNKIWPEYLLVLGKRVATIASGMMYPGTHSVEINSSDYETGLYYYRLRAGNHSITKNGDLLNSSLLKNIINGIYE